MKPQHRRLVLEQLDKSLERLSCIRKVQRPTKGWLRAVREALGMSGKQFALRLGVSAPWVSELEKKESSGSVTIKTMRQAAEALDCVFVYGVIPQKSLSDIVRRRAVIVAEKKLGRVSHSMLLEAQQLTQTELRKALDAEVERLVREMPKELWDKHDEL